MEAISRRKIFMEDKINCPYCDSSRIRERVAIRYEDYDKSYPIYRCRECGREFSEKDLKNTNLFH
jgi:transposase-like protein